jgi:hypothetical protein
LLVINISKPEDYKRFCDFIGKEAKKTSFPWANKTSDIKPK